MTRGAELLVANSMGLRSLNSIPGLQAYYDALVSTSVKASAVTGQTSLVGDLSGQSGVNGLILNAAAGNNTTSTAKSLTGNQVITADVALASYASGLIQYFYSALTGNNGLEFYLDATGHLAITVGNGTAYTGFISTVAVGSTAYSRHTLKAVLTDNSGVVFSLDGVTLDTVVVNKVLAASTQPPKIGTNLAGIVYGVSITGSYNFDATTAAKLATFIVATTGETWIINTSGATGARISGARDAYQGTGANQARYLPWSGTNYGWLPGVAGNNFQASSSTVGAITSDISIMWFGAWNSIAPATQTPLASKWLGAGHRSYILLPSATSNRVEFVSSEDGTATKVAANSTADVPFVAGQLAGVLATFKCDNGSGGSDVIFYTSVDGGASWQKLGNTVTTAGATSIFNSDQKLTIGSYPDGTSAFAGKAYWVKVYSGIFNSGATLSVYFNPAEATDGATSWVSSTSETWTVVQALPGLPALIVGRSGWVFDGSASFLKSAPFPLVQPEWVVLVGRQLKWTDTISIHDGNAAGQRLKLWQSTTTPSVVIMAGSDTAINAGWILNTTSVVTEVFNGASSSLQINRGTATTGDAGSNNASGFTLGSKYDGTSAANIVVNAVAIFSTAPTAAQIAQVVSYFARRFAIPV